jgi:hypothetical protein
MMMFGMWIWTGNGRAEATNTTTHKLENAKYVRLGSDSMLRWTTYQIHERYIECGEPSIITVDLNRISL